MTPIPINLVTHKLCASANAHPLDVLKTKALLAETGHYQAPEWGVSHFPDPALFSAVQDFQRTNGLRVDGVMNPGGETEHALLSMLDLGQARAAVQNAALAIQGMGRNGDELLAHITPEEARLLDAITDGGSVNPRTGLLEFWWGDGLDDNDAQGGYDAGAASDNQAAENDRQYSGGGNDHESGNDNNHGGNGDGSSGDTLGGNGLNKSQGAQPGGVEVSDDAARDAARGAPPPDRCKITA